MARATRWSEAVRLTSGVSADWGVGEDPEACAVEVLFVAGTGASYVVFAVGPSPQAAVAAAEEEARRWVSRLRGGDVLAHRVGPRGGSPASPTRDRAGSCYAYQFRAVAAPAR